MVYESDFYTTRRTRPTVSSYSVTVPTTRYVIRRSVSPVPSSYATYVMPRFTRATSPVLISVPRLYSLPPITVYSVPGAYHRRTYPVVAHTRITAVPVVPHRAGRNAAYLAEMSRIGHRLRPRVGSEPCENFLNSEAITNFDDETRAIRARTKELLRRVNEPIPRSYYPDYSPPKIYDKYEDEEPLSHEEYIEQRVFSPMRHVHQDISTMSRFNDPARQYIGKGHLACVSFAGGRPIQRRRAMPRCDEDRNVRDDVKFLSYYNRARAAALTPGATLEVVKALLAPPYHRRDPQPELIVMPYSRPRAPASFLYRFDAFEREKNAMVPRIKREIKAYAPTSSKSKELVRLRLIAERDSDLGKTAYAESQQAAKAAKELRGGDSLDDLERAARKKQREMEMEEAARREVEERRAEREASKRKVELERQQELDREAAAERAAQEEEERKIRAEEERKAELERQAEAARLEQERQEQERQEAERRAEEMKKAEAERLESEAAEKKAEAERKAEEEKLAAERKAEEARLEAEKKAEEARLEAERKAEEDRKAEEARVEAEKKAEEERIAAEKKAEEERLAAEKAELERQEAEKKAEEEAQASQETEAAPEEVVEAEAAPAETEATPAEESSPATEETPAEEAAAPEETTPTEEPVVEEPQSPDQPLTNGSSNHTEDGPVIEELEIPLEGDSAETVVKKVQDASLSEETEA